MDNKKGNPVSDLFEESVNFIRSGNTKSALYTLFKLFKLDPCHTQALEAASKLVTLFNDLKGSELLKELADAPSDVDTLYELGYHFINMGQPDVAKSFLEPLSFKLDVNQGV